MINPLILKDLKGKNSDEITSFIKVFYNDNKRKISKDDNAGLQFFLNNFDIGELKGLLSYEIKRLDHEFDLLIGNEEEIINIEFRPIKKTDNLRQLIAHYNILSKFYEKDKIKLFTITYKSNKVFELINNDVIEINSEDLQENLRSIVSGKIKELNMEIPSLYIEPSYFFDNKYILSVTQEDVFKKIKESTEIVNMVNGDAGTGKTLLAFNCVDYYQNLYGKDSVAYVVPIKINKIIDSELIKKYNVITAIDYRINGTGNFKILIIDEAQRLNKEQIDKIINGTYEKIIFFSDSNQELECISTDLYKYVHSKVEKITDYKLSKVIRSDETFLYFAKKIVNKDCAGLINIDSSRIEILYKDEFNPDDYKEYQYLKFTPSRFYECMSTCKSRSCQKMLPAGLITHDVLGTDYKNVIINLCDEIKVKKTIISRKKLVAPGNLTYLDVENQLYNQVTRTREHLVIVVYDMNVYTHLKEIHNILKQK